MMKLASFTVVLALLASSTKGFAPTTQGHRISTELAASMDRRSLLGAIGVAIGGAMVGGVAPADALGDSVLLAANNPALQTFKGSKKTKGSFIPGKGIRQREDLIAANNPALQTFKGRNKTKGSFIPGKGIRQREDLIAANNPALQTFKGSKKTKGSFIPGKGIRQREELIAANNPALQTFKARKPGKGSFIPGKGLHSHGEFVV